MNAAKATNAQENIIGQARRLFLKHGIRRVSVQEICREAGVSKMTFYRAFKNKEDVAEKVLLNIITEGNQFYENIMAQAESFTDKMHQMLEWKRAMTKDFSEELLRDIYNLKDPKLKNLIETHQQESLLRFLDDLKKAQQAGELRQDLNLKFVMYMLNDIELKSRDEQFIAMFGDARTAGMALMDFFFHGILSNK